MDDRARPRSRLRWLELGLYCFGSACLLGVAWWHIDAYRFQRDALTELAAGPTVVESMAPAAAGPPEPGTPLARLSIPRLELAAAVAEGTSERVLQRAIGHLARSAPPGSAGHVVLAAHRDTYFRPLEHIRKGDAIELDTATGRTTYEVEWFGVVGPSDIWVLEDTDHAAVTLITCYPFRYIGDAPHRFVVRARAVGEAHDGEPALALPAAAPGPPPSG
jgi:sortase A